MCGLLAAQSLRLLWQSQGRGEHLRHTHAPQDPEAERARLVRQGDRTRSGRVLAGDGLERGQRENLELAHTRGHQRLPQRALQILPHSQLQLRRQSAPLHQRQSAALVRRRRHTRHPQRCTLTNICILLRIVLVVVVLVLVLTVYLHLYLATFY